MADLPGIVIDANPLIDDLVMAREVLERARVCGVPAILPAHVQAELWRWRSQELARFADKASGLQPSALPPTAATPLLDDVASLQARGLLAVEPFTDADAATLVELTRRRFPCPDDFMAFKLERVRKGTGPLYRRALEEEGVSLRDRQWVRVTSRAKELLARRPLLRHRAVPGTIDWLTIGMAARRDMVVWTAERDQEFAGTPVRTTVELLDELAPPGSVS